MLHSLCYHSQASAEWLFTAIYSGFQLSMMFPDGLAWEEFLIHWKRAGEAE